MTGHRARERDDDAFLGSGCRMTIQQVDVPSGARFMSAMRWINPVRRGVFMLPPSQADGVRNVV
jgi:hypothetical protein